MVDVRNLLDVAGRYATLYQRGGRPDDLAVVQEFLAAAGRAELTLEQRKRLRKGRAWLRLHAPEPLPEAPVASRVQCPALCVPCGVCEGGCGLTAAGWPLELAAAERGG